MPRPSKINRASLLSKHAIYGAFNQAARTDSLRMAELGHPMADEYRKLRRFFDSLRYACNASARFFSFGGEHERSEFWAPNLTLSWYAEGALRRFGHVYPAHDRWEDYIEAAAALRWAGAEPRIEPAGWLVATRNKDLVIALARFAHANDLSVEEAASKSGGYGLRIEDVCSGAQNKAIADLVREYQTAFVLPARTRADDEADAAELPLHDKQFAFAAVSQVTVTPRMVMVPLLPLGDTTGTAVRAVNDVVALVRGGYPFDQVRTWLKPLLTAAAYRALRHQFDPAPRGA